MLAYVYVYSYSYSYSTRASSIFECQWFESHFPRNSGVRVARELTPSREDTKCIGTGLAHTSISVTYRPPRPRCDPTYMRACISGEVMREKSVEEDDSAPSKKRRCSSDPSAFSSPNEGYKNKHACSSCGRKTPSKYIKERWGQCKRCYNGIVDVELLSKGIITLMDTFYLRDIRRLMNLEKLNDKLLHFHMHSRLESSSSKEVATLFDTLFVQKMLLGECHHELVRETVEKQFMKPVLLFPIFDDGHFSLFIFCETQRTTENREGYFIHLDSCVGQHTTDNITKKLFKTIESFTLNYGGTNFRRLRLWHTVILSVAQQEDVNTCGYHVCFVFENLLKLDLRKLLEENTYNILRNRPEKFEVHDKINSIKKLDLSILRLEIYINILQNQKEPNELYMHRMETLNKDILKLNTFREGENKTCQEKDLFETPKIDFKRKTT